MTWYVWHQQWSSLVDMLLNGELAFLTKDWRWMQEILKWWLVAMVESGHVVSVGKECRQPLVSAQYVQSKKLIHKRRSGIHDDLSRVDNGFKCRRCNGTNQEADLVGGWRDIWMCKEFFAILEILLMEMVERILLLQLESEMDGWSSEGVCHFWHPELPPLESSVCQLRQKQHDFGKWN